MKNIRKAAVSGIVCEIIYFLSVSAFLITHTDTALILWEIMTVAGAAVLLIAMMITADTFGVKGLHRTLMIICLSGTLFLTSAAHFTSIGVTMPLEAQGADIPDFVKIGHFPSYEMTVDYTAWGMFMGCAFLMLTLGTKDRTIKILTGICSALCLAGFIGSFFSESLWYMAPMGYGPGFLILCIIILCRYRHSSEKQGDRS